MPSGDTADRTLVVRLESNHPNPRSRPLSEFECGDAADYARRHRRTLLAAALTCVRAWVLADCPCPPGEEWVVQRRASLVPGLVRWLFDGLDPLDGRSGTATSDPETESLAGLLAMWKTVMGEGYVTAGRVRKRLDNETLDGRPRALSDAEEALRERLIEVCRVSGLPNAVKMSNCLTGIVGRRVPLGKMAEDQTELGWLEEGYDSNLKQKTFRVVTRLQGDY